MSGGDSTAAAAAASPQPLPFSLPKPPPLMQLTPGDAVRPVGSGADQSPKSARLAARPDWPAGKPVSLLAPLLPPRGDPEPLLPFGPGAPRPPLRGRLLGRCGGSLLSPAMRPAAVDRGSLMVSAPPGTRPACSRGAAAFRAMGTAGTEVFLGVPAARETPNPPWAPVTGTGRKFLVVCRWHFLGVSRCPFLWCHCWALL